MLRINLLISTINEGIERVSNLLQEPKPGISYIIIHQYTAEGRPSIPEILLREDVRIIQIPGKGLSISRNEAIKAADGDIAIIADDDVTYLNESFEIVRKAFEENQNADVICFKIKTLDGEQEYKKYPKEQYCINIKKKHYISSIEISFRISSIRNANILFDERFGIGSENLPAGEEQAFIGDCIHKNIKVYYCPEYYIIHPYLSSAKINLGFSKENIWILAALSARNSVILGLIVTVYRVFRLFPALLRNRQSPITFLKESFRAIQYIQSTSKNTF
jgi:glycosyltransferase involved in cell wall biosynthesis